MKEKMAEKKKPVVQICFPRATINSAELAKIWLNKPAEQSTQ